MRNYFSIPSIKLSISALWSFSLISRPIIFSAISSEIPEISFLISFIAFFFSKAISSSAFFNIAEAFRLASFNISSLAAFARSFAAADYFRRPHSAPRIIYVHIPFYKLPHSSGYFLHRNILCLLLLFALPIPTYRLEKKFFNDKEHNDKVGKRDKYIPDIYGNNVKCLNIHCCSFLSPRNIPRIILLR